MNTKPYGDAFPKEMRDLVCTIENSNEEIASEIACNLQESNEFLVCKL